MKYKILYKCGVIVITVLMLVSCNRSPEPPVGEVTMSDISQYLQVNTFVQNEISSHFQGILPEANVIETDTRNMQYLYNYQCALLGDPNFLIYLRTAYESSNDFSEATQRMESISANTFIEDKNARYYFFTGDPNMIDLYLDEDIRDGTSYRLEIAEIHEDEQSITYYAALLAEGCSCPEELLNLFENILRTEDGLRAPAG